MNSFINLNQHTVAVTSICFQNRKLALLSKQARLRNIRIETGHLIEKYFFDICDNLSINLLVECGAHDATISVKFCAKNSDRHAISFEANPYVVARFEPNIKNEKIKYLNIGLAEHPGILKLNIPSHSPKSWTPQSSFSRNLEFDKFDTVDVEVNNLDYLTSKYDPQLHTTSAAIWIDVEGFGWEVLNGAKNILSSSLYKVIFIEVQDKPLWENEKTASQICSFLEGYNYVPIVRDCPLASLYNIVFVKKEYTEQIVELTNNFWFDFARIKPAFYEKKSIRASLGKIKNKLILLSPNYFKKLLHKISALFGSKSSKEIK